MRIARRAALAAALLAPSLLHASRPMTLQDLLLAVRVADPQVSSDGRQILYVRTTTDLTAGKRNADVWIAAADGSGARALTTSEKSDNAPRFSPDGKRVAFLSARGGTPQIYVLDLAGGEARKLTSLSAGAQAPLVWSPDGTRLAFVSDVHPDCADEACNKKRDEEAEASAVKVHKMTRLLHRHWDEWRTDLRHHVFVADAATGAAKDVTPGDFDSPTVMYEDGAVAFSPDAKELAFVSNRDGNDREASSTNMDVFVVKLDGDLTKPEKLTANPAADTNPVFLKDGRVLVKAQRRPGCESDRWYIDVYDRKAKSKKTLFETPDLSVGEVAVTADGGSIAFTAESEGRGNLYTLPLAGGTPREIVRGGSLSAVSAGPDFFVYSRASLDGPAEIFRASLDGKNVTALTRENEGWKKDVGLAEPESFTTKGAGGAPVQAWMLKPPGFDAGKKYPTVFLIHGGPQGAWEDGWSYRWNPALWAAQGWVVVCPNPRGSTGFGQKFVDEISQDWGGKVMEDLTAVFDAVAKKPFVDGKRLGIAGASYGGYAVDWLLGHTDRFKAAVTHDGVFNLDSMANVTEELWFSDWEFGGAPWTPAAKAQYAKWSPHLFADKITTPTLIITNELDYRVPVDQGLQLFTVLRRRGVPSEALVFPDEGHWVLKPLNSKRWHEEVFAWMKKYL